MDTARSSQYELYKTRRKGKYQAFGGGIALITAATLSITSTAMYGGSWITVSIFPVSLIAYILGIVASFNLGKFAGYWNGLVAGRKEHNPPYRSRFSDFN